jgi:Uncharacterized protein conserved in bacteria (DUF2087)
MSASQPPAFERQRAMLSGLAVKNGVSLGGLSHDERQLVLALAATAVPAGQVLTEAQVNQCLKAALAGRAGFLATDHVELRRWLVDAGWLRRDGFGRAYERVAFALLPQPLGELDAWLAAQDVEAWIAGCRQALAAAREARRAAWQAGRGAAA